MTARPHSNVATGITSADLAAHNLDPTANQAALNAQSLNGHSDTNLGAIADKQVAIWDAATSKYIPINYRLASLTDVNLVGLVDQDFLKWDAATSKWTPVTLINDSVSALTTTYSSSKIDSLLAAVAAHTLGSHTDTAFGVPSDNDIIKYDASVSKFTLSSPAPIPMLWTFGGLPMDWTFGGFDMDWTVEI